MADLDGENIPGKCDTRNGDIVNPPYDDSAAAICDAIVTDAVISNEKGIEEHETVLSVMQIFTTIPSPILDLDSEKETFGSDIIEETPLMISSLPDLSRFCEDIESQVPDFLSEDMLELNNWDTETENDEVETRVIHKIEKDDSVDNDGPIRSIGGSESSGEGSIGESQLEEDLYLSSSSDDLTQDMNVSVDKRNKGYFSNHRKKNATYFSDDNDDDQVGIHRTRQSSIPVATMTEPKGAKRKWDKTFLCIFCKKSFSKLPRHWYMKHADEKEVENIMSYPSNSKEKKRLIAELQNRGITLSNTYIIKTGKGSVVTKRRPRRGTKLNLKNYISCRYCKQLFLKTYIDKHERKRCSFNAGSKR